MSEATKGSVVKVHYTGKLEDGTVFDSSEGQEPMEVELGANGVIPGFENGLLGMKVNEKKTINISIEDGYGPRREEMVMDVTKSDFPENITPEVGLQLTMENDSGQEVPVTISKVEGDKVTLDGNHPLAGKVLVFDLELVDVS